MIADEDAVDHIAKNHPQCDRSHGCAQGALLALKLTQSGIHHKKEGLTGSQFLEGICWEREGDLFQQGLQ